MENVNTDHETLVHELTYRGLTTISNYRRRHHGSHPRRPKLFLAKELAVYRRCGLHFVRILELARQDSRTGRWLGTDSSLHDHARGRHDPVSTRDLIFVESTSSTFAMISAD